MHPIYIYIYIPKMPRHSRTEGSWVTEVTCLSCVPFPLLQWHGLSREEQAKYYEKARLERQKHMQMYPHWNARDNYRFGLKKKKRKRDKTDDPGLTPFLSLSLPVARAVQGAAGQVLQAGAQRARVAHAGRRFHET